MFRFPPVSCPALALALALAESVSAQPAAPEGFVFGEWGVMEESYYSLGIADFGGDGKPDLMYTAGVSFNGGPRFRIGTNSGSSFPAPHVLTPVPHAEPYAWVEYPGDFNGDGLADVLAYKDDALTPTTESGALLVGINLGGSFEWTRRATLSKPGRWSVFVADFDGDGLDDVLAYQEQYPNGQLWVGINDGVAFHFTAWATVQPAADWLFAAADFTGDGRDDVVGYHWSNQSIWVGASSGSAFSLTQWGGGSPITNLLAGEFNGAGAADIVGYDVYTGAITVGLNTGSAFALRERGAVVPTDPMFPPSTLAVGALVGLPQHDLVVIDQGHILVGENRTPQCNNEIDDDGDGLIDFGADAGNDPNCASAMDPTEKRRPGCGLGAELAAILPVLALWRGRRRSR